MFLVKWKDGVISRTEWEGTVKELLLKFENSAYTTIRTIENGKRLLELSAHIERLGRIWHWDSFVEKSAGLDRNAKTEAEVNKTEAEVVNKTEAEVNKTEAEVVSKTEAEVNKTRSASSSDWFKDNVTTVIIEVIRAALGNELGCDYRITVILCQSDNKIELFAVAEKLPKRPESAQIEIKCLSRSHPTIKSTSWVAARQSAEELKHQNSNEIVMLEGGELTEGLSSNFGMIGRRAGKMAVFTAPKERVLAGTILQVAKEAAMELGIEWIENCPKLQDLWSCDAAFLSSTSRLVLPVDSVTMPDGNVLVIKSSENQCLKAIGECVNQILFSRSTLI